MHPKFKMAAYLHEDMNPTQIPSLPNHLNKNVLQDNQTSGSTPAW